MPTWGMLLRPLWVPLVLCYWTMLYPHYFGLGFAWSIGLLLDVLNGTLLGQHALALTLVSYVVMRNYRVFRHYPLLQQGLLLLLALYVHNLTLWMVQWFASQSTGNSLLWLSPLFVFILWPGIISFLRRTQLSVS